MTGTPSCFDFFIPVWQKFSLLTCHLISPEMFSHYALSYCEEAEEHALKRLLCILCNLCVLLLSDYNTLEKYKNWDYCAKCVSI